MSRKEAKTGGGPVGGLPNREKPGPRGSGGGNDKQDASPAPLLDGLDKLMELCSVGAPQHRGHVRAIPHAPSGCQAFYTTSSSSGSDSDAADLDSSLTRPMTLNLTSSRPAKEPWQTLEQPSNGFRFGARPGTVTLNHLVSRASAPWPTLTLRDSGVEVRPLRLKHILERLRELEAGLEANTDARYRVLYRRLLHDPDGARDPHRTLDRQITDLIYALSRPGWIDFTKPKNQVPTRFLVAKDDKESYRLFMHQLLLCLELERRINAPQHARQARERLMGQIPPTMQWGMAVARRWWDNVRIKQLGSEPGETQVDFVNMNGRVKELKTFAEIMKWPDLEAVLLQIDRAAKSSHLDDDTLAYFSGLVLPGPTFPFVLMNALLAIDVQAGVDLGRLSACRASTPSQSSGFQYRHSHGYWLAECIVGKVLAPKCRSLAGWVGPAPPTPDLTSSQTAQIRSRKPDGAMDADAVKAVKERSSPMGNKDKKYLARDFRVAQLQSRRGFVIDHVRFVGLGLQPVPAEDRSIAYDASVSFAVDGDTLSLALTYDVDFVCAWPCFREHTLCCEYHYRTIGVDELVDRREPERRGKKQGERADEVLVVEAFGVAHNEVLARAWCAELGLSAIVADVSRTCLACAIREAYAAKLTVVILVKD